MRSPSSTPADTQTYLSAAVTSIFRGLIIVMSMLALESEGSWVINGEGAQKIYEEGKGLSDKMRCIEYDLVPGMTRAGSLDSSMTPCRGLHVADA